MKEQLIKEFDETTREMLFTLTSFNDNEINKVPFKGSWTAGQVAEHLLKSESNIPKVLRGNSKPSENDGFEKTGAIQSIFLDYTKQLQSPPFILPSEGIKDKDILAEGLENIRKEVRTLIDTKDLTRTFTDFPFPQLGEFTGWEWICFVVCHSKRHIRQMKIIAEKLQTAESIVTGNL